MEPKKHHYVPSFYLKKWAYKGNSLIYYRICGEMVLQSEGSIKKLGSSEELYSLKTGTGNTQLLETTHYKSIDDKAAKVLNSIIKSGVNELSITQKFEWVKFIASLLVRNPSQLQKARAHAIPIIQRIRKELFKNEQVIYQSDLHHFEKNLPNLAIAAMSGYEQGMQIQFFDNFTESLLNSNWWIEDFSEFKINLLTSDTPVSIFTLANPPIPASTIADLLKNEYLISLPITPKLCFYAYNLKKPKIGKKQLLKTQNTNLIHLTAGNIYTTSLYQDIFIRENLLKKLIIL